MNKKVKFAFWVNMFLMVLVLLGTVLLKYVSQAEWVKNFFDVVSYLYMFSFGYAVATLENNKSSTLKGL